MEQGLLQQGGAVLGKGGGGDPHGGPQQKHSAHLIGRRPEAAAKEQIRLVRGQIHAVEGVRQIEASAEQVDARDEKAQQPQGGRRQQAARQGGAQVGSQPVHPIRLLSRFRVCLIFFTYRRET